MKTCKRKNCWIEEDEGEEGGGGKEKEEEEERSDRGIKKPVK